MKPLARTARSLALLLAGFLAVPAFAVSLRMEAETTWAENISRSSSPTNWIDTLRQEAHLTASQLAPLATGVSFIGEAGARYTAVPRFSRDNTLSAHVTAALRTKFGLGPFAPVLTSEISLRRLDSRLPGADSWVSGAALHLSKRFSDQWRASVTGDWEERYAAGSTFDTHHHRLLGSLSWDLTERWQLTYGYGSLWGDFVSNASAAVWARALAGQISPAIGQLYNTLSWNVTDSYGPGWVSYRATGRSDFWWLELSPALGPNTSLPLRFESSYTVNRVNVHYRQSLWTLGLLHRF